MKIRLILLFLIISTPIVAQELVRMPNLMSYSTLEEGNVRIYFDQRFKAPFDQESIRTFFGLGGGTNTSLGFSHAFKKDGQEISAQFRSDQSEYEFSYSSRLLTKQDLVSIQGKVALFTFQESEITSRNTSYYASVSIQPKKRIKGKLLPILNLGFSGFTEAPIIAFGGDFMINDTYSLIGEYTSSNQFDGIDDIMTAGILGKYDRNNLLIFVQNSYDTGIRKVSEGNPDSLSYFLGFRYETYIHYRTIFTKREKKKKQNDTKDDTEKESISEPKPVPEKIPSKKVTPKTKKKST
jgi:hypothetical protein